MKKWISCCIALFVFCLAIQAYLMYRDPLRKGGEDLRREMFQITPLGMNIQEVEAIARQKGYRLTVSHETGFYKQKGAAAEIVGEKSIRGEAGDYWSFPYQVSVTFFWGFDRKGRLIDVWVWKVQEGI